jgi:acetyltransferase-like isoleucine patch superfamily enzyme
LKALREIGLGKAFRFGFFTVALVPYRLALFPQLRAPLLRLLGARIGRRSLLHDVRLFNLYRRGLSGLVIGRECFLGDECMLDLAEGIELQDQVTLGERTIILTHINVGYADHPLQRAFPPMTGPVRLESGCFVGAGAIVLPGVTVGREAFVAAGSVVTKDVKPRTLVGGVPAREIRGIE